MACKPKTQPCPDAAAVPAPKFAAPDEAAALSFASPPAADVGSPAPDDAGADVPAKRLAAKGRAAGRSKRLAGSRPSRQNGSAEPQDQASGQPEAEASLGPTADGAPVQPNRDPAGLADEAAQPVPKAEASAPTASAARRDRATDTVQFDWPAIERVAVQSGPNQAMAKLLVAARAEGAGSRWPF